ncbi:BnaCnng32610D [Brassica napus]|uniref:BnaCnng32610D protein n=1 Tax=Brassica napus TaxID=3708 RepID=A0A078J2X8_BRANA|nr:BnaCnng32610D [Brassica napus]
MGADICSDNRIGLFWTGDWCWNRSCYEDD